MAEGGDDSSGVWYPLLCILGFYGREGIICRVGDSFLLYKCTTFSNLFLLNVKFLEAKCHAFLLLCLMHDILWMVNKHHIISTLNCPLESCPLSCFSKRRCFPRKEPFKSMPTNVSPFFPGRGGFTSALSYFALSPLLLCPQTPIVEYVCEPLAPVPITSNTKWQLPTLHIIRFPLGETLKTIIGYFLCFILLR